MKLERIDKILSNLGYGSRKDIKNVIKKGNITIDGVTIKDNKLKINPYDVEIKINGETVKFRKHIYLMMNKPKGVISATFDSINKTVIDLIDKEYSVFKPFPIGRLDKDTEGLLLLSNDGELAHNLLSPKKHINKKYYVELDKEVNDKDIEIFKQGVDIGDYTTLPAELKIIDESDRSKVIVIIQEGKFHQIKRMFKAIDNKVKYLKRIKMGDLELDSNLKPGEYRELTDLEIEILTNARK